MFPKFSSIYTTDKPEEKESQLLERIAASDESALSELYDLYSRIIYSLIIRIVKSREEAEDLLQLIFVKIWYKAGSFDKNKGSVYSWVVTMARNNAIDRIRSKQFKNINVNSVQIETIDNCKSETSNLDTVIMNERADIVNKALKQIPQEQSAIIELAYFGGMTQSEIAQKLSIPIGTIKSRTRQALIKLEKILSPFISYSN
jgi:RNA polymerase sigma-70 factor, ECF subfamily